MTLSLAQPSGIPHYFDSVKELNPDDQVLWPCSKLGHRVIYAVPVKRISQIWSPTTMPVEILNTYQDQEPKYIKHALLGEGVPEYPGIRETGGYYFLAPQFNPKELATIRQVAQRSLTDYRMNLHSLIAFDYLEQLKQVAPLQGNKVFPPFKQRILDSLYELSVAYLGYNLGELKMEPHLVQSTENLRNAVVFIGKLLDAIQSPHATRAKEVGAVWARHLSFYSYPAFFLDSPTHNHQQLERDRPLIQTDTTVSHNYCQHLASIYHLKVPYQDPALYQQTMELYLKNRQNGELYNDFLTRFLRDIRKVFPVKEAKEFYQSPPMKSYTTDLGLRRLLDQILYQQDIPGFENDRSLQITNERIFETLALLIEDKTVFKHPAIAALHARTKREAFEAYNSCHANEFSEHRILDFVSLIKRKFKTPEDRFTSIYYHMLDFMRNIKGNIDVVKIQQELFALHALLSEQGQIEPEFEQALSHLLNIVQFQQDLYYLRDLKIPENQRITPLEILEEMEKREVLAQTRPEVQIASPTEFDRESSASPEQVRPYTPSPAPLLDDRKEPELMQTPRDPKLREIIRDLEQTGFIPHLFAPGKGVHRRYVHKDFPKLITMVPFHSGKSVKKGTLESIYDVIRKAQQQGRAAS